MKKVLIPIFSILTVILFSGCCHYCIHAPQHGVIVKPVPHHR